MGSGNRLDLGSEGARSQGWLPGPWEPLDAILCDPEQEEKQNGGEMSGGCFAGNIFSVTCVGDTSA